jgi:hypothetical protein
MESERKAPPSRVRGMSPTLISLHHALASHAARLDARRNRKRSGGARA